MTKAIGLRMAAATVCAALMAGSAIARAAGNQSATGHAVIVFADGSAERFSFNAVKRANGKVTGEWELFTEQFGGVRLHGEVSCLTIVTADRARMAGPITQSTSENYPVGTQMFWTVVDNGEGSADLPDRFSDLFVEASNNPNRHCDEGTATGTLASIAGNIQVRP